MKVSDFNYDLPPDRIAQQPLAQRDASRLMVIHRHTQSIEHQTFASLPNYLQPGDLLVLNDTQVIPCRLTGQKRTGGKLEVFLLRGSHEYQWEVLIRGKINPDDSFSCAEGRLIGRVIEKRGQGRCLVEFSKDASVEEVLETCGQVPLPPYIQHFQSPTPTDRIRYQTIFAKHKGAVAAPTAGLHFTESLLQQIQAQKVEITFITLHVGLGTFQPVKTELVEDHPMEPEFFQISEETLQKIFTTKERGGRIIACGTTSTRVLESFGQNPQAELTGWTNLFIYPGFSFKVVDLLITNFHLPQSTLLMLVSAFGGREFTLKAYELAIQQGYRFYSYGDGMIII